MFHDDKQSKIQIVKGRNPARIKTKAEITVY